MHSILSMAVSGWPVPLRITRLGGGDPHPPPLLSFKRKDEENERQGTAGEKVNKKEKIILIIFTHGKGHLCAYRVGPCRASISGKWGYLTYTTRRFRVVHLLYFTGGLYSLLLSYVVRSSGILTTYQSSGFRQLQVSQTTFSCLINICVSTYNQLNQIWYITP